jgi:hypothetical protein
LSILRPRSEKSQGDNVEVLYKAKAVWLSTAANLPTPLAAAAPGRVATPARGIFLSACHQSLRSTEQEGLSALNQSAKKLQKNWMSSKGPSPNIH